MLIYELYIQGTLQISDSTSNQQFKTRRIFLFEQSCIVADCILPKKEFGSPTYIFKNIILVRICGLCKLICFQVNKMRLDPNVPDEPLRFIVRSSDPAQSNSFLAAANTLEEKEQWLQKINVLLESQQNLIDALQDPRKHQKSLANNAMSRYIL
jgi:hypothetical protein